MPKFIANGGWVVREITRKPRARLFGYLSLAWFAAAVVPVLSLYDHWPAHFGRAEWTASALLSLEPVLVLLALGFWLKEPPRQSPARRPNPDFDRRKLY